jgi:TolB-like protein/tetratricopeptide (TPR) repeat protein
MVLAAILILFTGSYFIYQFISDDVSENVSGKSTYRENSIAVLPFSNISADTEQDFFCDGMTEQIISNLSRIQELKVISRTSVMKFKETQQTIPEIAGILNVNYVLEGSVRRSSDRIRVTAQLISTKDDFHVWSEDYDKQVADIFDLQDDISKNIVTSMLRELTPGEVDKAKVKRTKNIEAYEYFLKGKYYHEKKFIGTSADDQSFRLAEQMFKKSVSLDSTFALPNVALADLYHSYYLTVSQRSGQPQDYKQVMNRYLNTSFSLDSTLGYNYLVKGRIYTLDNGGWMNQGLSVFLFNRGLYEQAITYINRSIEVDPLEPLFHVYRGLYHHFNGDFDQAEMNYQRALQIEPQLTFGLEQIIHLKIDQNQFQVAEEYLARLDETNPHINFLRAKLSAAEGERKEALELIEDQRNLQIYALLDLREETKALYQNSLEHDRKSKISYYHLLKTNPCYDNIRDDEEFQRYLVVHKEIYEQNLEQFGDL